MRHYLAQDMGRQLAAKQADLINDAHRLHRDGGLSPAESVGAVGVALEFYIKASVGFIMLHTKPEARAECAEALAAVITSIIRDVPALVAPYEEKSDAQA